MGIFKFIKSKRGLFYRKEVGKQKEGLVGFDFKESSDDSHTGQQTNALSMLELTEEAANIGTWVYIVDEDKGEWSMQMNRIFGVKKEYVPRFASFLSFIHPQDREEFKRSFEQFIDHQAFLDIEYRILREDNKELRYVHQKSFIVPGENGEVVRVIGTVHDITEKKLNAIRLKEREQQIQQISERLIRNLEEEKLHQEKLQHYANHDYLTDLPNMRKFDERLKMFIIDASTMDKPFAVLYIGIDRFRFINDSLGYSVGDQLLKKVSDRLAKHLLATDYLARRSGDEFAIILNTLEHSVDPVQVASNIMSDLQERFVLDGYQLHITASIGIGLYPEDGLTVTDLSASADVALHRAKALGKNNIQVYSPSMNIKSYTRFVLENDMRKAIQQEQFFMHYQPKIDPRSGRMDGAEALLRWKHPELGIVSPSEFISLAEESNLILELGDWVIGTVCKQIKKWKLDGMDVVPISINISAKRFLKDDLVPTLQSIMQETGVEAKWLELEITETSLIQNGENVSAAIKLLKDLGVAVSLDDFGTGYASINYLRKFKVDFLKIDRSFITGIGVIKDDEAIIRSILYLARELNMKVVAEGVETEAQLLFLLEHQCHLIQGYFYSKPLDAAEFSMFLSERMSDFYRISKVRELAKKSEGSRIPFPVPMKAALNTSQNNGVCNACNHSNITEVSQKIIN